MTKRKTTIFTLILISILLVLYFVLFSSSHYKITTPVRKNLFSVRTEKSTLLSKIENSLRKQPPPLEGNSGICASPGCGNPYGTKDREDITLLLTDEQITSLLEQYKPISVLLTNIKVEFSNQTIFASATSLYPFMLGQVSVSARLHINHFYVNDAYIGKIKAPEKIANFLEANGDKMIKDMFVKHGIWLDQMELVDGKLSFKANVPKGMITVDQDGTILVNLYETQETQGNAE